MLADKERATGKLGGHHCERTHITWLYKETIDLYLQWGIEEESGDGFSKGRVNCALMFLKIKGNK